MDGNIKCSRTRSQRQPPQYYNDERQSTSHVWLLTLLVFFVGLIAIVGVIVGVFVWVETKDGKDSSSQDTLIIDNRPLPDHTHPELQPDDSSSSEEGKCLIPYFKELFDGKQ